jgi:hypothetical protein
MTGCSQSRCQGQGMDDVTEGAETDEEDAHQATRKTVIAAGR